tara:strand:+ start:1033 stop:1260 length:228 start_codon:yes stop_codon:yes gene_type:complete
MKIIRRRKGVRVEMLYGEEGNVVLSTRGRDEWKGVTTAQKGRCRNKDKIKKVEKDVERLPIGQALHLGGDVQTQS